MLRSQLGDPQQSERRKGGRRERQWKSRCSRKCENPDDSKDLGWEFNHASVISITATFHGISQCLEM